MRLAAAQAKVTTEMNWTEALPWMSFGVAAIALLHSVYGPRSRAASQRVSAIEARVDVVEDRMTKAEAELKHVPDRNSMHNVELRVSELSGAVATLAAELKPVTAMGARIQEFLIEQVRFK
jgi:hypothetical protein